VVARHGVLRTVFLEVNGAPRQRVLPALPDSFVYEDLTHMETSARFDYVKQQALADATTPFDLTQSSIRALLLKIDDQHWHFRFNQHHIITDTWSMELWLRELTECYQAILTNRKPNLAPKPLQYVDFAVWHDQETQGGQLAREEQFWLQTLAAPLPVLDLPTDLPRPEMQTYNGAVLEWDVPRELTAALREAARQQGVSIFMLLMAAYQTLLHHLTGDEDIIVGTPVLGRTHDVLESVMGFFANTVAVRVQWEGVTTLSDLLQVVKLQALDAFEHQLYPFDLLVEQLGIERDISRPPVFSTMFAFNTITLNDDLAEPIPGVRFEDSAHEAVATTAKFDLTLAAVTDTADADKLALTLEYNTDLFLPETAAAFVEKLLRIFEAFAADPMQPIGALDLLTEADRAAYAQLNGTPREVDDQQTIAALFEQFVALQPDHPAAADEHRQLSFQELNDRATHIAHDLRQRGVGRGDKVAVLTHRNVHVVVAFFAIMKAGAAYVPVDRDYPLDRIAYMLEDADVAVVLTETSLRGEAYLAGQETIAVDALPDVLATGDLPLVNEPDDLCYVIYTSGSTGRPKGVQIRHRNLIQYVLVHRDLFGYNSDDVLIQMASLAFDVAVSDIATSILNGGSLYVADGEKRFAADTFAEEAQRAGATRTLLPAAFFAQFANLLTADDVPKLARMKTIFFGGEVTTAETIRTWQSKFGTQIELVNVYGPTEITVAATAHRMAELLPETASSLPIGRAMPNAQLYILNEHQQLCPVHVAGELYIGGPGVGIGYLNQPERTAEAFVELPFRPGESLYKTGDIVRLLPSGELDYLSRNDDQVKVRGFRIELGEIEERFLRHPQVQTAAVIAPKGTNGVRRLIGYYTTHDGVAIERSELLTFLRETLPDYMVPQSVGHLAAMPLTPNGKIDRRNLPSLFEQESAQELTPPRTPLEARILDVFQQCLRRESIGVLDNFFEIGGDSIISMQVASKLRQAGVQIQISDLFKLQTVANLARHAEAEGLVTAPVTAQTQETITGVVPLSHIQAWAFAQPGFDPEYFFLPFALDIAQPVVAAHVEQTVRILHDHHDMLRAVYTRTETGVTQTVLAPAECDVTLLRFDLSAWAEEEQEREYDRIEQELAASLTFDSGLMNQAALFTFAEDRHRLLWIVSHLYNDTYTQRLLPQDFMMVYEQVAAGGAAVLPEKTVSYKEWVETCHEYANSEAGVQAMDAWQDVLADARRFQLPMQNPAGRNRVGDQQMHDLVFEASVTEQLRTVVTAAFGVTLKDVVYTLVLRGLARWSGQEHVAFTVNGHGRDAVGETLLDLSRTVGFFTMTHPFAAHVPLAAAAETTLQQVALRQQQLPLGGASFLMLRALCEEPTVREQFAGYQTPEVLLNFHGELDNVEAATGAWQPGRSAQLEQPAESDFLYKLALVGAIADGQLFLRCTCSEQVIETTAIQQLQAAIRQEAEALLQAAQLVKQN